MDNVTWYETKRKPTIKELLKTAFLPVGNTMYVWGGGWNNDDTGAGKEARTVGVSSKWENFFKGQRSGYDFKKIVGQRDRGLDCAGYIGWVMYNVFHNSEINDKEDYVMPSTKMAGNYARRGWGVCYDPKTGKDCRPGDIMSMPGHVWMVVGSCEDGSVVLVHSSPPGVQVSGTPDENGGQDSLAVSFARNFMMKRHPVWYERYGHRMECKNYLPRSMGMCWDVSGKSVMSDPDGFRNMGLRELLNNR